ncbi:17024_t:CDS:2 [Funneliformis caledonium]|uniref:17024_t:CDS:1 n=1 Tax=Funneliformis caledonium TaxID=1117310 RepID=A0A9N9CL40_9GLOM|nr:17024_t:CDS:2 [Funneliformis caledonium]
MVQNDQYPINCKEPRTETYEGKDQFEYDQEDEEKTSDANIENILHTKLWSFPKL